MRHTTKVTLFATIVGLMSTTAALADPAHDIQAPLPAGNQALTPAQQVALPDGGAPPPPHGYTTVEDNDAQLATYSATVRTHRTLGLPGGEAHQSTSLPNNAPSHFSLFGIPVKFNAPVRPPYTNNAYQTYAGSPGNGQTDVAAEAAAGQP
ncbi:hypothetical protein AA101099_2986 [Neoasaia chiangmaiensis NBRC 101099]|uniref:Uncharacterized protein n=1 Tax=Neoasaia chiangmaiensis TaxID=320497 RepID=A0A1U9KNN4_9PROT|nr:hypothetical protein [Neoasaia chiangmaiensis]AQS87421.1 hypothetical protein A0U93_05115 [Neoasaia chiangmaiensis]GBR42785.1 hypothetical protein AA101099_2986 [Neoasaia chiangmaiensis NBRC 101099]GEN16193.1 hypothetical protein NCH01_26240 [Neoasaia chiangmaiensis]